MNLIRITIIILHRVDVTVHRLGGGFGGKIDACNLVHTATAIAACKFRKPVHVTLTLEQNMTLIGWRDNWLIQYKVGNYFHVAPLLYQYGVLTIQLTMRKMSIIYKDNLHYIYI